MLASVSTGGGAVGARSVEVLASVSTDGGAVSARSVEEGASVSTGGGAAGANSVVAAEFEQGSTCSSSPVHICTTSHNREELNHDGDAS